MTLSDALCKFEKVRKNWWGGGAYVSYNEKRCLLWFYDDAGKGSLYEYERHSLSNDDWLGVVDCPGCNTEHVCGKK